MRKLLRIIYRRFGRMRPLGRKAEQEETPALILRPLLPKEEAFQTIVSVVAANTAISNLQPMQQIDTATRKLARKGAGDWSDRLACFPAGLTSRAPHTARDRLTACLDGIAQETDQSLLALVDEIGRLEPDISVAWWIFTYVRLFRSMNIKAARLAKRVAARRVVANAASLSRKPRGADVVLAAALYGGDATVIDDVLRILVSQSVPVRPAMQFDALLSTGRLAEARVLASRHYNHEDHAFATRVDQRRIALVGPARNRLGNGAAIDRSDLVVRTNFIDSETIRANAGMLGTRTDISYYNSKQVRQQEEVILATLRNRPELVAAVRSNWTATVVREGSPLTHVHRYNVFGHVFFGRGFALRHAIADLLRFDPASITVYGADFFLSPETHYKGYNLTATNQVRAYITHDVFDTWSFMKMLREKGILLADQILAAILDMSEEAFADALAQRIKVHGGKRSV